MMNRVLQFLKERTALTAAMVALMATPVAFAQQEATVHGHVQNMAGQTVTDGQVKFTTDVKVPLDQQKFDPIVQTDKDGNYTAKVPPGDYLVYVVQGGKPQDRLQMTIKPNENKTVDFDMTREEYINALTPEQKKQLAEFKAKNAEAVSANKQVANLNATITAVRADIKTPSPNFDKDMADMKTATDARPTEGLLWAVQGDVLTSKADHAAATDRTNKTNPMQDDAVTSSYSAAIDSYKKALDLMGAAKTPNPEQQASVYNQLGTAYARSGKPQDATASYDKAVSLQPKSAGVYYSNESAILYNAHQDDAALAAAEKAIAADPTRPEPYYVKGQELLNKATVDAKGQIVPPPGCVDAYQKYLELAPDGPQAESVKEVLTSMGQKITTKYKAGAKH